MIKLNGMLKISSGIEEKIINKKKHKKLERIDCGKPAILQTKSNKKHTYYGLLVVKIFGFVWQVYFTTKKHICK